MIKGLYPSHHLWGISEIKKQANWKIKDTRTKNLFFPRILEKIINCLILKHRTNIRIELATLIASRNAKLIYSVCGPLALSHLYHKTKVIPWVFSPPVQEPKSILDPYHPKNLKQNSGFLCLTPKAENYFSQFATSKFIPWCVDLEMFDGKPSSESPIKPFFLANGKTGRDYETLVESAHFTEAEVRIIGSRTMKPAIIPKNVTWIDSSNDPPDQAIDYPTLKEWYAQCSGVCIPLSGDADDTCGYTNILEGMAMRKPVLMTRSGCLHINPEKDGFGMQIKPRDAHGWAHCMNHLLQEHKQVSEMGNIARKIVERDFTIERFNKEVIEFIKTVLNKT